MSTTPVELRGVVCHGTGGVWHVLDDAGVTHEASLRGRLKQAEGTSLKLAVGDEVVMHRDESDSVWAIAEVLPRRSVLARRAPGGAIGERVIVANPDQVMVVFAAANPEPHPRMLDRFLVIAEANELRAIVVINKVDLVAHGAARERFIVYEEIGYRVFYTSSKRGDDLESLHNELRGRTTALSGPSGVGKSSLLNSMYPGSGLRVGEISQSVNKGRHTTVGARLLPLPDGGYVADTPGLREIGMWGLDVEHLDQCFPEIRAHVNSCRFKDCSHVAEPKCAVRDALRSGEISLVRYDSYIRLRTELEGEAPQY